MRWLATLFIRVLAIVNRQDADDALVLIDAVEEPKLAQSVSPSFRGISLEFLDVVPVVGLLLDLRIDVFLELRLNKALLIRVQAVETRSEFFRFENPVVTQRISPSSAWHRDALC